MNPKEAPTGAVKEVRWISLNKFRTFDNPGDCLTGSLVGYVEEGDEVEYGQFMVLAEDGIYSFNKTQQLTILEKLPPGTNVRIEYTGDVKTSAGYKVKLFDVQVMERDFEELRETLPKLIAERRRKATDGSGSELPHLRSKATDDSGFVDPFSE